MVPYIDIIGQFYGKSMWCGITGCEVAELSFQANANYGTWSIDFALYKQIKYVSLFEDINQSWKGYWNSANKWLNCKGNCYSMINFLLLKG